MTARSQVCDPLNSIHPSWTGTQFVSASRCFLQYSDPSGETHTCMFLRCMCEEIKYQLLYKVQQRFNIKGKSSSLVLLLNIQLSITGADASCCWRKLYVSFSAATGNKCGGASLWRHGMLDWPISEQHELPSFPSTQTLRRPHCCHAAQCTAAAVKHKHPRD